MLHIGPWLEMRAEGAPYLDWLKGAAVGAIALGLLLTILGGLFASFTVFTAISIFGVFLGTGAPIIALSVMSGFEADLKSKIRATKADIVISAADDRPFTDWKEVQEKIAPIKGVVDSMAYIESEVIVKHASNPAGMGIILRGIDATRAPRVLDLARKMSEGKVEYLVTPDKIPPEDIELIPGSGELGPGRRIAGEATTRRQHARDRRRRAGAAQAGEPPRAGRSGARARPPCPRRPRRASCSATSSTRARCTSSSAATSTSPARCAASARRARCRACAPFRVAGHFYTGMYEFDSKLAYISLPEAQKFLGMQGEVTGVEVRTVDPDRARDVAEQIVARIGPGFEVRTWEELNRGLFMALRLEKIAMFVVLTFIALVASFSIVSNLIMLVTEKAKEVAILKSMGARDVAILRVFFAEGLYIGLAGAGAGPDVRHHRLRAAGALRPADRPRSLLHPEASRRDAGLGNRVGEPGGAGSLLPGDDLPGLRGVAHAAGRRIAVRVSAVDGTLGQPAVSALSLKRCGGLPVVDTRRGGDYLATPQ